MTSSSGEGKREELVTLADELDLTTLGAHWDSLLACAEEKAPGYTDFALGLLRFERDGRRRRKAERSLKRSRLGTPKSLDEYDFSLRPKLEARVVKELLNCEWVRQKRPLVCLGRPGTGKTHVVKALGQAAIDEGFTALYVRHTADMLAELRGARVDATYKRVLRRYEKPDVLVLDEFGYEDFDKAATDDLFRLISARHEQKATVVAANTGFRSWHRFFPSKAHAVATVDRLVDRATILRFTGKSCRKPKDVHGDELSEGE
jgi:DNA replication protein DnaC